MNIAAIIGSMELRIEAKNGVVNNALSACSAVVSTALDGTCSLLSIISHRRDGNH